MMNSQITIYKCKCNKYKSNNSLNELLLFFIVSAVQLDTLIYS